MANELTRKIMANLSRGSGVPAAPSAAAAGAGHLSPAEEGLLLQTMGCRTPAAGQPLSRRPAAAPNTAGISLEELARQIR